jgi:ankyrin repeat protein
MLACAGSGKSLDCVKILLSKKARINSVDEQDNTLLHIAAANSNNKVVDYLVKNVLEEKTFARNKSGETALNVCQRVGNTEGANMLKGFQADYDKSANIADQLMNELEAEDEKAKAQKDKNKDKKKKQKVKKIAQEMNLTMEEAEVELVNRDKRRERDAAEKVKKEAEDEERKELAA